MCETRNEYLSVASREIPFTECYPELWILNDEDYPRPKRFSTTGWLPGLKGRTPGFVPVARKRLRANLHPAGSVGLNEKITPKLQSL
jgi:hypothetical protein